MDKKFAYIVAASKNYTLGLKALLNSLKVHGNEADVILLLHGFEDEDVLAFKKYDFRVIAVKSFDKNQVQGTAIKRFELACKYGVNYSAICLLDADMFITADPKIFFEIASKGFIVTASNGMIINFNSDYQKQYNIDLNCDDYPYAKIHTTVPIFISPSDLDWFQLLYDSPRVDSFDDFLFLNILGIKLNKPEKMLCMPPYMFTGIHHWMLKPETSVIKKGGLLLSGTEEQVYMVHGKWWDEPWISDLPRVMYRYLKDQDFGSKNIARVDDATKLLKEEFENYLNL